jgi:DNA-binding PadR family transcriptional regulator
MDFANDFRLQDILYKDLYSGFIRLHVLHHAAEESIFGLGIIEELSRHGYKLSPGTMYPILHGLEKRGLLRSREVWANGHRRLLYRATPLGRRVLKAAKEKVRELLGELAEGDEGASNPHRKRQ